jgi:hypothetical protein
MTGTTLSQEQIQKNINNAFASVSIITNKLTEEKTEKNINIVDNNSYYLQTMLFKKWFIDSLTTPQYNQIKNIILSGVTYCN